MTVLQQSFSLMGKSISPTLHEYQHFLELRSGSKAKFPSFLFSEIGFSDSVANPLILAFYHDSGGHGRLTLFTPRCMSEA
jgi:hypothetical protein